MKQFHANRLNKLADFLDDLEPKLFNLRTWCTIVDGPIKNIAAREEMDLFEFDSAHPIKPEDIIRGCGSTACALGWAASMPEFRKRGLGLFVEGDQISDIAAGYCPVGEDTQIVGDVYYKPENGGGLFYEGIEAGAAFFGLDLVDAKWLFYPDSYGVSHPTASHVAKRIRQAIKDHGF